MVAHQLASAYAVPSGNAEKQGVRPNINVSAGHLTVDGLSGSLPNVDRGGPLLWSIAPLTLRTPDADCKTPVLTWNHSCDPRQAAICETTRRMTASEGPTTPRTSAKIRRLCLRYCQGPR